MIAVFRGVGVERASRLLLVALLCVASIGAYTDDVARGDAAWASRAEGERDGRPLPGPIEDALRSYERAFAERPQSLEACWKLVRALYFAGYFVASDPANSRRRFERAQQISERGHDLLAQQVGSGVRLDELAPDSIRARLAATGFERSDVARFYFWSAINWGAWSRTVGLLSAVRQGVANRLYRYTSIAIALEPDYEDGGPLRLMGRLHAELPRVPFVSAWVDRAQAIPLVERAHALAPTNEGNRLLLALTLLDLVPERRGEAIALLKQVEALTPRPFMRIEDLAVRKQARERLAAALAERS